MLSSIFLFFNISGGELMIVLLVVVMFFGADKIPEIARGLGKGIKAVRNATNDIKSEITRTAENDDDLSEVKKSFEEGKKQIEEISGAIKRNTRI
ncbi:MAG: twin-arginine translocase TatA/TatE family subunit [Bacteroidota bacterium]|mgnify:CR=1 FL=1|nr:twin-arginine translocase TatA/TatE family subunit [Bacteroidota bacterium]MDX5446806.1 twin-arginine translocase TatA/TatE family subunit [Bacteroidota bacterium]MDX5506370.1 twin-arginine translocase TatA/TatE family subunit [Bacteroidota bacterium]